MTLNTSCPALAETAAQMEQAAREKDHARITALPPELDRGFHTLRGIMEQIA
jgi:hypothetical protein